MENTQRKIILPEMDAEVVANEIGDFIVEKTIATGKCGGAMGLSGGIDSTTTAGLAKRGYDRYNITHERKLELDAYLIPSKINSPEDTADGASVAKRLGIRYEILNIEPIVEAHKITNPEAFEKQYDKGNLVSRIRANVLNTKAATENKLVIGTGNKDEDFGIGYYTLFGDGAVHMSPIAGLSKRLVRQMAAYLGFDPYFVNREPTAGLEPGQTDYRDLGYGYDMVELVTEGLSQGFSIDELMKHDQVVPLAKKQITEYETKFGRAKFENVEDMVKDIYVRNKGAELKAELLHPPQPIITLRYEK